MLFLSEISYIYYFLPRFTVSCGKLVIFLLYNNLSYTKYFAHSYTVDVVLTFHIDILLVLWRLE